MDRKLVRWIRRQRRISFSILGTHFEAVLVERSRGRKRRGEVGVWAQTVIKRLFALKRYKAGVKGGFKLLERSYYAGSELERDRLRNASGILRWWSESTFRFESFQILWASSSERREGTTEARTEEERRCSSEGRENIRPCSGA